MRCSLNMMLLFVFSALVQTKRLSELWRDDHAALHVGMILAEIVEVPRLFHHQACRLLRCDGNIPVAVRGSGGMRQNVLVDPFDSVPDLCRYFGGGIDELVDCHLNCRR